MYFNKVKNKMSLKVEIETYNEVKLWREMNGALKAHNSRKCRQEFYPHNMDKWYEEHREIELSYRKRILESNKKRQTHELNTLKLEAAEGLLKLKNSKVPRSKSKKQNTIEVLRRSSRIAEMEKKM
tara:strand:+ start:386 stop:763 length:378 start_codon:yes stop_codon:yes gene_type:complete